MSDYIEVGWYLCGVYQGKRKVDRNSIVGKILSDDMPGASRQTGKMVNELNQIPGVAAGAAQLHMQPTKTAAKF